MAIDQSKIGRVVAEQMEAIEQDHGDEDCMIGDVCVIVEVICPDGGEVRVRCSDQRPHIRTGLLAQALQIGLS